MFSYGSYLRLEAVIEIAFMAGYNLTGFESSKASKLRKIFLGLVLLLIGGAGYSLYDGYMAGYHTRPEMPEGAFSLSYKNGFRAILVGVSDERSTRRYFGRPNEVPFYVKDAWSQCIPPIEQENSDFLASSQRMPGERMDAVCRVDVDGEILIRGFITTVPKL